ncbi:Sec-independent protein translocase protein TatB [Tropicimonas isoalkanivorans]|uniref:Sec-independent protein translocase protein TatB n=1 Tax=Tropicimonas isoalkanivorans TaxID=441112 RepID=A0A1I1K7U0_9RHOB|nr:Sec-independent protein translocase protein TatB [Tropicimonas isoalkanivorans]SFC56979.1 sec-independent protein translocase protein TatB [Tropicimonas isoalkanivorans]
MFDLGWTELMLIGIVALIVVGPKDLPVMFRTLGKFTARMRGMAREFTRAMEDAADESGVRDVAKDFRTMTSPRAMGADALRKATTFDDFDPFGEDDEMADEASARPAKKGPKTAPMTEERADAARKIRESAAAKAQARLDSEAEVQTAPGDSAAPDAATRTAQGPQEGTS